jgi:AraC family transcriptional regulator, regulatory protein of adaptative response / methylated-DNA-[protein]-cysteine methyltransferase
MLQSLPDSNTLYNAILTKDESFEGIFIVGVKTTGICCRPTCTARKPKQENVEFFNSVHEALLHGYRPCKICNPLGNKGEVPSWLQPLINEVNSNPGIRLTDYDLRTRGIEPHRVRRWFKQYHGMTFQTYLRTLRIGNAFGRIQFGDKVIEAALESGYESISGFNESFRKTLGVSPGKSHESNLVTVTRILTPLGPMLAGGTDGGICLLEFIDRRMLETQIKRLRKLLKAEFIPGNNKYFEELNNQIHEYFSGKIKKFDFPLVLKGTPFQEKVWKELQTIPYGVTRSYQDQAENVGNIQAVRAVAKANGDNRIAIIIPCHRVIGKNGKLTGYGGGLWRKQYLLDHEKRFI